VTTASEATYRAPSGEKAPGYRPCAAVQPPAPMQRSPKRSSRTVGATLRTKRISERPRNAPPRSRRSGVAPLTGALQARRSEAKTQQRAAMWAVLSLSRTVGEMSPMAHAQMHQLLGGVQKSVGVSSNSDAQMPQSIARRTSRSPSVSLVFRGEDGAISVGFYSR